MSKPVREECGVTDADGFDLYNSCYRDKLRDEELLEEPVY